jgi:hypothetical protein
LSAVVVRDPGPMARLAAVKADEGAPAEVFRLLTDADEPKTLDEIAKMWAVPRGRFVEWFTSEHAEKYDAALKVLGASLGHKVLALTESRRRRRWGFSNSRPIATCASLRTGMARAIHRRSSTSTAACSRC